MRRFYDFLECDRESDAERPPAAGDVKDYQDNPEVRRRVGEVIARAVDAYARRQEL